ncbi:MAG: hypothetical protein SCJ93_11215 [Bacillota bacterium]|nr:hypothetical protein [Bacillota bacterium]
MEQKIFKNTRIYDLNGDFEVVHYMPGWGGASKENRSNISPPGQSPNYEMNRQRTLQKARSKLRRIIKCFKLDRFITLTFAENIQDVGQADAEFRKFMKRIRRRFPELKYVAVREFQKRGAVHYHMAVNTFINQEYLKKIWGNGHVWIERRTGSQQQVINYICKYISKHMEDERLKGRHAYLSSQGLSVSYEDCYFSSKDEMLMFCKQNYGEKMKDKKVLSYDDNQVVWIG